MIVIYIRLTRNTKWRLFSVFNKKSTYLYTIRSNYLSTYTLSNSRAREFLICNMCMFLLFTFMTLSMYILTDTVSND